MNRGLIGVIALLIVVGAGVSGWLLLQPDTDTPVLVEEGADPGITEPQARTPPERTRIPIPRPERRAHPPAAEGTEGEGARDDRVADDSDTDLERRSEDVFEGLPPDEAALWNALTDAMKEVNPEMVDCLGGWDIAAVGAREGRITFAFRLDADGLQSVDVLDVTTVPEATVECLGDVFWEDMAWPETDEELEVSWPVKVSVREDEDEEQQP